MGRNFPLKIRSIAPRVLNIRYTPLVYDEVIHVIARLVIPGSDLESLKHKASQHLALVDDEGDIEEGKAHRG